LPSDNPNDKPRQNNELDRREMLQRLKNQKQQIDRLKRRVDTLESVLSLAWDDASIRWLFKNRSERMDPTVDFFDADRGEFHLARYRFAADYVSGKIVADIACGTGYGTELLATAGSAREVVGIDICQEAIDYAIQKHAAPTVRYLCQPGGSTSLPDGSIDAVVSFETIEHVDDETGLLDEFARVLRPDGMLICSTPNQWPLDIAPHHVREYDRQSFLKALLRRFRDIKLFNQNSGSDFKYNRGQPQGILPTTAENYAQAECYLAVCNKK